MRASTRALIWEQWRQTATSRRMLAFMCAFWAIVYALFLWSEFRTDWLGVWPVVFMAPMITFASDRKDPFVSLDRRLFRLPVPTVDLVVIILLTRAVQLVVAIAALAFLRSKHYDDYFTVTLAGDLFLALPAYFVSQFVAWLLNDLSETRIEAVIELLVLYGLYLPVDRVWPLATPGFIVFVAATGLTGVGLCWAYVGAKRKGMEFALPRFHWRILPWPKLARDLRYPDEAIVWLMRRGSGRALFGFGLVLYCFAFAILLLVLSALDLDRVGDWWLPAVFLGAALFATSSSGIEARGALLVRGQLTAFLACRPVKSETIAATLLAEGLRTASTVLAAMGFCWLMFWVGGAANWTVGQHVALALLIAYALWGLYWLLDVIPWSLVRLWWIGCTVIFAAAIMTAISSVGTAAHFWTAALSLLALPMVAADFVDAYRNGRTTARLALAAATTWTFSAVFLVLINPFGYSGATRAIVCGLFALTFRPIAVLPLTIEKLRHE